jgi:hypothetical protein
MTDVIYIELKTAAIVDSTDPEEPTSKYRVNLSPVDSIDDTYKNTLDVTPPEDDTIDPHAIIVNTKNIIHVFTLNGMLKVNDDDALETVPVTRLLPDPTSVQGFQDPTSKLGRLRILLGYGGNITNGIVYEGTTLNFYINGITYECWISRLTTIPTAGQVDYMDYIIELTEGKYYGTE